MRFKMLRVPSHVGITGNEMADSVARSASSLPFIVHCGVPRKDLFLLLERDHQSWRRRLWTLLAPSSGHNRYFDRVSFKTARPWFSGLNLDVGCGCGAALKSLSHLIRECPIFSDRRPRFFRFLSERFPGRPPEQVDLGELIFPPDPEAVGELRRFFCSADMII